MGKCTGEIGAGYVKGIVVVLGAWAALAGGFLVVSPVPPLVPLTALSVALLMCIGILVVMGKRAIAKWDRDMAYAGLVHLRIQGDWQEAVSKALKKKRPPEGWPRPKG